MLKTSFSSVACPEWTLDRVAALASETGYDGVELRTFGANSTQFACDPALTSAAKVRRTFKDHGVSISCLATGVGFDEPIRPAVIGRVFGDPDRTVRLAKAAIDLAAQIECPLVRVFGFELPENERYAAGFARVVERLAMAVDGARNTGVKVVLENAGTFSNAGDLKHVIDAVANSLLGASYSVPVAFVDGEDPLAGIELLGDRLMCLKLRDFKREANGTNRFCVPGDGDVPCERVVREAARRGFGGWVCVEWDRAWLPELALPDRVLAESSKRLFAWGGAASGVHARAAVAR